MLVPLKSGFRLGGRNDKRGRGNDKGVVLLAMTNVYLILAIYFRLILSGN